MTDSEKKLISRTLQLKPVKFSELKDGNDNTLPVLMRLLADTFTTVGERMDETGTRIDDEFIPDLCTFFNNYQELDEKTCIFEVWSYEPGVIPQTLTPDPDEENAVVDTAGHVDNDGEKREFIHIAHVLAYGHSAIVESTRSTGGVYNIQRYLNKMARKAGLGRKGTFFMTDAVTKQLSKEIDRAGGAVGFTVGVTQVDPNSQSALIGLLSNVRGYMPSSGLMTVDWRSKDKLPTKKVIEAYDEAQKQDEVESVIIHLSDGSSIRGLSKFKIKQTVHVADVGGRNPSQAELKRKMVLYLEELCTPGADGKRILDESGALADNEIFIPNSRRSKKRETGEG